LGVIQALLPPSAHLFHRARSGSHPAQGPAQSLPIRRIKPQHQGLLKIRISQRRHRDPSSINGVLNPSHFRILLSNLQFLPDLMENSDVYELIKASISYNNSIGMSFEKPKEIFVEFSNCCIGRYGSIANARFQVA
jgi:hypothetical protein